MDQYHPSAISHDTEMRSEYTQKQSAPVAMILPHHRVELAATQITRFLLFGKYRLDLAGRHPRVAIRLELEINFSSQDRGRMFGESKAAGALCLSSASFIVVVRWG
jgi:hypothetical protein